MVWDHTQGAALLAYRASEPELFARVFPHFGLTDVVTRTLSIRVCESKETCFDP